MVVAAGEPDAASREQQLLPTLLVLLVSSEILVACAMGYAALSPIAVSEYPMRRARNAFTYLR